MGGLRRARSVCVFLSAFSFVLCAYDDAHVNASRHSMSNDHVPRFLHMHLLGSASGCVIECQICNREVAGSNLSLGYFAPRSTQPSIPPGSVNEYQLRLGRQRQVWLIPIAEERVGVQVKLWNPLRTRAIPERFCGGDSLRRGAISSVCTFTFTFTLVTRKYVQCTLSRYKSAPTP